MFKSFLSRQDSTANADRSRLKVWCFYSWKTRITLFTVLTTALAIAAIWNSRRVHAASFASTQSGSWGDPATWGGAGVPGNGDDVTISSGNTVTLDTTRASGNLTINGTLSLTGNSFLFHGTNLINNGNITGGGGGGTFFFEGINGGGGTTQNWSGAGTYGASGAISLRIDNSTNVAPAASVVIDTLGGTFQIDGASSLSLSNAFIFKDSTMSNGGSVSATGSGLLKTQGMVSIGSNSMSAPLEVVNGTTTANGNFGTITIDNTGTLKLNSTLNQNQSATGSLTVINGGTLNLAGNTFNFGMTTASFFGTLTGNTLGGTFFFQGIGFASSTTQTLTGSGIFDSDIALRLSNSTTVNTASGAAINGSSSLTIDGGSALNLANPFTFANSTLSNNGSITGASTLITQGTVTIASAALAAPLEVNTGTTTANGNYGNITIDNTATLKLNGTLNEQQTLGGSLIINTGGTLNLSGNSFNFGETTATLNGTLTGNTSGGTFFFNGVGFGGGSTQNLAGNATFGSDVTVRLSNSTTVNTASGAAINGPSSLTIDGGSALNLANPFTFANSTLANNGSITGASTLITQGTVTINSNALITPLEVNTGTTTANGNYGNLTIDNGATLKLNGTLNEQQTSGGSLIINTGGTLNLQGSSFLFGETTATLNGTLTGNTSGGTFFFDGVGFGGGSTQNLAGNATFGSDVTMRLSNSTTVNTASGAAISGPASLTIDGASTLNLANPFTFANSTLSNNGSITGASTLITQGTVTIDSAALSAPLDVNTGTTTANGNYGDITIDNTATLKLNGTLNEQQTSGGSLIINTGGTLNLQGSSFDFGETTFTNNGAVTGNSGGGTFFFQGVVFGGGSTQNFGGAGAYGGDIVLRISNSTTVVVAASTGLTGLLNFTIDGASTLTLNNALTFPGPGSGTTFAIMFNNGSVSGSAGLKTQGNAQINNGSTFSAPLEVVSDTTQAFGTFTGPVTVDSGAALKLIGTLASGDLTFNGTLNLNGNNLFFQGTTYASQNGVLTGGGSGGTFFFNGISGVGGTTQQVSNGVGSFPSDVNERISNSTTVLLNGDLQVSLLTIDGASTLNITNHTLRVSGSGTPLAVNGSIITTGSTIEYNGAAAQSVQTNLNGALYDSLTVNNAAGVNLPAPITIPAILMLTNGAFSIGANTLTLNGSINSGGGTLTGGSSSNITFGGSGASTTLPQVTNGLQDLTINRANGITLGADLSVIGLLTLTSGDLTTAAFTLMMPNTASSTGSTDVVGNVLRTGFVTGGPALSFGNPFNSIQVTAGTPPANINVNLVKSVPTGSMGYSTAVQRTYTITPNSSGFTATLRLHYLDSELNGNLEAGLNFWRFDSGTNGWRPQPATNRDATNNWVEKAGVTQFSPWTLNSTNDPTAAPANISGQVTDTEGAPLGGVLMTLTGAAQVRRTITNAAGTYSFTSVETNGFYTITPMRANYVFAPGERSFTLLGDKTDAVFAAVKVSETANPLDTPEFFVRQHYLDFLDREPDQGGLDYWSGELRNCPADQRCINNRRIDISAAFFVEPEFQQTGSFVYRMYKASLGRQPRYAEFTADRSKVVVGATLDEMKQKFADQWVTRAIFQQQYPETMNAADFVNKLFDTAGLQPYADERQQQIDAMTNGGKTRAAVLRDVIEIAEFKTREYNPSFVLMQYFGYLRRDIDTDGYNFWLDVINNREVNNYRGMVCAFITSAEYQLRFSSVVTHTNQECGSR